MHLVNALLVCDKYGLFLQSAQFSIPKDKAFQSYLELNTFFSKFYERGLSALTLSWQRSLLYRNQSIDFIFKSMDWFLHGRNLRLERVKSFKSLRAKQM